MSPPGAACIKTFRRKWMARCATTISWRSRPGNARRTPSNFTVKSKTQTIFGFTLICTNSFHHQAVKEPGAGLIVTGRTEDGIVEAVEDPTRRFVVGVQWHPEGMFHSDPVERRLFTAFVESAARRRRRIQRLRIGEKPD